VGKLIKTTSAADGESVMATSSHNMNELENVSKGDSGSQKIVVSESELKITRVWEISINGLLKCIEISIILYAE